MGCGMNGIVRRARLHATALRRRVCGLAADERGVSAVEFALLLPLMLALYLGSVEISQGVDADRKVTMTVHTVADLVARVPELDASAMSDVFGAASTVMAPFPAGDLKMTVSSVTIKDGKATVDWSETLNGAKHAKGEVVDLPAALLADNGSLIWAEAQYSYKPIIGYVVTGTLTLGDRTYMSPRKSKCVTYVPAGACESVS